MADRFNLKRFVDAQDRIYPRVLAELRAGRKQSHWMWYVFPQIAGLGLSAMSQTYAIASLDEAQAYLAHPVLGARLRECTGCVVDAKASSAEAIFGAVDAQKLFSSMTLFARAGEPLCRAALDRYFEGREDEATLVRI